MPLNQFMFHLLYRLWICNLPSSFLPPSSYSFPLAATPLLHHKPKNRRAFVLSTSQPCPPPRNWLRGCRNQIRTAIATYPLYLLPIVTITVVFPPILIRLLSPSLLLSISLSDLQSRLRTQSMNVSPGVGNEHG